QERPTALRVLAEDAATARRDVIKPRVCRRRQHRVRVDEQRDAGAKSERTAEKYLPVAVGPQLDGLPGGAVVHGLLDASGVGLPLRGLRQDTVRRWEAGPPHDAGGRDRRV